MAVEQNHPEINVEDGRLTAALHEILTVLGVSTSTERTTADTIVTIERDESGTMRFIDGSGTSRRDLLLLSWSLVAGANVVGRVNVRVRDADNGPVFVSLESAR